MQRALSLFLACLAIAMAGTAAVSAAAPKPVVKQKPTIPAQFKAGTALNATPPTWQTNPTGYTFSYRWLRCDYSGSNPGCVTIPGIDATDDLDYTPTEPDVKFWLRIRVTATTGDGTASTQTNSAPSKPAIVAGDRPVIDGDIYPVGTELTATAPTWQTDPSGYAFAYQWLRCDYSTEAATPCASIEGGDATDDLDYTASYDDIGMRLRVKVTATDGSGSSANTTSNASREIPVNGWSFAGAPFHLDFTDNRYWVDGPSPLGALNVVRNAVGFVDDSAGNWRRVPTGAARRSDRGLLVEGKKSNFLKWSSDLTKPVWVKNGVTATNVPGFDGEVGSLLLATADDATVMQSTDRDPLDRIASGWVSRSAGSGPIFLTIDGGETWTDITAAVDAPGFAVARTPGQANPDPQVGLKIAEAGDAIVVANTQLENSNARYDLGPQYVGFGSSPIVTKNGPATRDTDIVSTTLSSSGLDMRTVTDGTVLVTFNIQVISVGGTMWDISDGTDDDRATGNWNPSLYHAGLTVSDDAGQAHGLDPKEPYLISLGRHRFAASFSATSGLERVALDGSPTRSHVFQSSWPTGLDTLTLGSLIGTVPSGGVPLNGFIEEIIVLPDPVEDPATLSAWSQLGGE